MLQNLMVDRMSLKVHHETRALPVNKLKIAEGGFKLNPMPKTGQGEGTRGSSRRHKFRFEYRGCGVCQNVRWRAAELPA